MRAIRGYIVGREFKTIIKPTESQAVIFVPAALNKASDRIFVSLTSEQLL